MNICRMFVVFLVCGFSELTSFALYYEWVAEWGNQGTNDGEFAYGPTDIAVSGDGSVYASDPGGNQIQVFSPVGTFLSKWSTFEVADNQTNQFEPECIAIDVSNRVYVSRLGQVDSAVIVFTPTGEFVTNLLTHGESEGQVDLPSELTFNNASQLIVADLMGRVQLFDHAVNLLLTFGSDGTDDNQFQGIGGIVSAPDDGYLVSDFQSGVIKKFTGEGQFTASWAGDGFQLAGSLLIDLAGNLLASDSQNNRVQILNKTGVYLGDISHSAGTEGPFEPFRMAIDSQGDLYVIDSANARIVKFSPTVSGPPVVSDPTSTNITGSTAVLSGTVTDDGGGTIIERGVYWSTEEGFTPTSEGTKVSETGEFGEGTFTIVVTDLPPDTTIYFKAFARHIATSGYSDEASFSTGAESIIYVNSEIGDDAYSGYSSTVSGMSGPKATLEAAMAIAVTGDTIEMAGGDYPELPLTFIMGERDITLRTSGSVTISEEE